MCGISFSDYNSAESFLNAGSYWPWTSNAKALLQVFLDGDASGLNGNKQPSASLVGFDAFGPTGDFSEWLTHNAGAPFSDTGYAQITKYIWNNLTSFADMIATSPQIEGVVRDYYNKVIEPQAEAYFKNLPVGETAYFPASTLGESVFDHHTHENGIGASVPKCTVKFSHGSLVPGFWDDVFSSIGRGRLLSHNVRYRVEKKGALGGVFTWLSVTEVQSWGEVTDLYDFDYEAGALSERAAIMQIGYGKGNYGRTKGKIFKAQYLFDKTYVGLP